MEDKIINQIMDYPRDINEIIKRKPVSSIWLSLLVIPLLMLFIFADCFTPNQATILSIAGSTTTAFLILLATLNKERRVEYLSARKSARVLSQIINTVQNQITRIINGAKYSIDYPDNWLDFYTNCSLFLKYDYLEYILFEFGLIKKINSCIFSNDEEGLKKLLEYRNRLISDQNHDFNIFEVNANLCLFASGLPENAPWKQSKEFIEFSSFFKEYYPEKVKELTVEYLLDHNNGCDADDAMQYVMTSLRKEAALSTGKHKYMADKNRAMLNAIFKIYLSLDADDKFSLLWGELSLKEKI